MPATSTDDLLREFLTEQRRERSEGNTLSHVVDKLGTVESQLSKEIQEIRGDMRGHSLRIGVLEKHHDKLEGKLEDTGRFELKSLHDDKNWQKRQAWSVVWTIAIAVVTGAVSIVVTLLLKR